MATMNFDAETVSQIQSLIDEHKSEISEGVYLKMCNITKHAHNHIKKTNHEVQPEPEYHPYGNYDSRDGNYYNSEGIPMITNPFWRNGPDIGVSYVPAFNYTRITKSPDNVKVSSLERANRKIEKEIFKLEGIIAKKARILNEDKYNALLKYCIENNINYQVHPKANTMTKKIQELVDRIKDEARISRVESHLQKMYKNEMNLRVQCIKKESLDMLTDLNRKKRKNANKLYELRNLELEN